MAPRLLFPKSGPLLVGTILTPAGLRKITRPLHGPGLAEVRVDALLQAGATLDQIEAALSRRTLPVLLTCRIPAEGGLRAWKKGERIDTFARLLPGTDAIDIELAAAAELADVITLARRAGKKLVLSAHAIAKPVPAATLHRWIAEFRQAEPDIAKIAARIETRGHLQALAKILLEESDGQRWAVMGVGPHGGLSREVLTTLGSALCYGWIDRPSAPGQPSADELARFLKTLPK